MYEYKIAKWRPTAAAVCLDLTMALVNSYEDTGSGALLTKV